MKVEHKAGLDMNQWVDRMCCSNTQDALMMMKYSDRLSDVFVSVLSKNQTLPKDHPHKDSFLLVGKKYYVLEPSMEFRLFVIGKHTMGICQRNIGHFYAFLKENWGDLLVQKVKVLMLKIADHIPFSDCKSIN